MGPNHNNLYGQVLSFKVIRRGGPDFIGLRMRRLECLSGGRFRNMLLPAFNHLGDLLRVLRRGVPAPHLAFLPYVFGVTKWSTSAQPCPAGFVHRCIIQVKHHGFDLLLFDTEIDVIKPSDSAFTEELRKQWDEYQQRKGKLEQDEMRRASDNKFVEEQLKIQGAARLATQAAQSALDTQRATDSQKEEME